MKDKELALIIKNWLIENGLKPHIWCKTETGKSIKEQLLKIGNWKNKPRGKSF